MRPTTDREALAAALHSELDLEHPWEHGCCGFSEVDWAQADRLIDALGELSWHLGHDVSLPESAPKGREGSLDLTDFTEQVLYLVVSAGLITTAQLNERYRKMSEDLPGLFPKRAFDTPRKRLVELERGGFIRKALGPDGKQLTWHGYGAWEPTDKGRERCPAQAVAA